MADKFDPTHPDATREPKHLSLTSDERAKHYADVGPDREQTPEESEAEKDETDRQRAIVDMIVDNLKISASSDNDQIKRELDDLRFDRALPEDQWPESIMKARKGGIDPQTGRETPERPCLTIPKLDQPVQQVIGEARSAHVSVKIVPKGNKAHIDGAEKRQGLYRAIEVDSRANLARLDALGRAAKCGRGFYQVVKEYVYQNVTDDMGPEAFDQQIRIKRILNQHAVYLDPFFVELDASDMRWGTITADVPEKEYDRRWPDATKCPSGEKLESLGNRTTGWGTTADGGRACRVAHSYYLEYAPRTLLYLTGIGNVWKDSIKKGAPPYEHLIENERVVDSRVVKYCITNGVDLLEEEIWDGQYIPIIMVIGKEYNVDGKRCWKGIISNAKDAQRSYNYMRSAQVTAIGLGTLAPWIMAFGQDEGFEAMWDQSNTKYYTRMYYNPILGPDGEQVPPPVRNTAEPAIQAMTIAVNEANGDIQATTNRFDPSLGKQRGDTSGRAIEALQQQGIQSTSTYLSNATEISMPYEALVVLDLMKIYDRAGRIEKILGEEDDPTMVMLNHPFVRDDQGQPVKYEEPNAAQSFMAKAASLVRRATGQAEEKKPEPQHIQMDEGTYGVVIEVGRSLSTKRKEELQGMSELAQAAPNLVPLFADLWVGAMDFPLAQKIAQRIKRNNPAAKDDDGEEAQPSPREQQLQQQEQMLQNALQQAQQEIEKLKSEADLKIKLKTMDVDQKDRASQRSELTELEVARLKADTAKALEETRAEIEQLNAMLDRAHEMRMALQADRHEHASEAAGVQHDLDVLREQHRHEHASEAAGAAVDEAEAERQRQHDAREARKGRAHDAALTIATQQEPMSPAANGDEPPENV